MTRKIFFMIGVGAVVLLVVLVFSFLVLKDGGELPVLKTLPTETKTTLFATMLAFNSNSGLGGQPELQELLTAGWSTLRGDQVALQKFLFNLEKELKRNAELAGETDFSANRDVVGAFVWNVIEPEKGTYDWRVTDATLKAAGEAGMVISAVIQPFAAWDQKVDSEEYRENCSSIDFGYYDNQAGADVTDGQAYESFLTAVVERYDGDGQDDMPGLNSRVEAYEIGNEVEGPCGGYQNNPNGYGELLRRSYQTIKAADPGALVLNAGALEINGPEGGPGGFGSSQIKAFWRDFFAADYDQYLDIFNFHYNQERNGAKASAEDWLMHLAFFNELMEDSQGRKALWVTEFGTYSGSPTAAFLPGLGFAQKQEREFSTQSSEFQAAWYFRYTVIGLAQGLARIFIDLQGSDINGIGASALFRVGGGKEAEPRAFLTTLQSMADILDGFESVQQIEEGQYEFQVSNQTIYALWSGSLPANLQSQTLTVLGIDGEEQTVTSENLEFNEDSPVLVWIE